MIVKDINQEDKEIFNKIASHPLQAYEWGEFRKKTGVKVIRRGFFEKGKLINAFQITIHKIPKTPWNVGYFPKGTIPTKDVIRELIKIGKDEKCIFIQLEPSIKKGECQINLAELGLLKSTHPLFTRFTFELDLTKSEDELLKNMHSKTRYNIRVAKKHGVNVTEYYSEKAFEDYLRLTNETTRRQKFYAHTERYHRLMWESLKPKSVSKNNLSAHLLIADYKSKPLVTWILFALHDTLYYPYGASSSENREVMASNLMMWEAVLYGKKLGLKTFDMWGALGPNPNTSDPWYGFHRFKEGYGTKLVEFVGSYDLVINPFLYKIYKVADFFRWKILRSRK